MIRVAFVGCGRISERHFDAINELRNDLELVAVCDTQFEKSAEVRQEGRLP